MFLEGVLLKEALRNVAIILWQSLSPVSMLQVLQNVLGLFASIILKKVPFNFLKQVLELYYVDERKSINEKLLR